MENTNNSNRNSYMYMLLTITAVFWAGAFIAGKYSIAEMPPFTVAFLRFFFASIFIFPIMLYKEKGSWKLKRSDLYIVFLLGLIGMFGYHVLFFIALKHTSAINSSLIASTNPVWVNILSIFILKNKIGIKRAAAIALSFTGVLLTITNGRLDLLFRSSYSKGDLIMILAILCWAVYTVLSKKVMDKYSPIIITTYSFITATILLLPFFIKDLYTGYLTQTTFRGWISVLYMALFPSVIGYLVWQIGIHKIGTSKTSLFANLVPVFSVLLSIVFLGETFSLFKLFTGFIIILGVYLNTRIKDTVN